VKKSRRSAGEIAAIRKGLRRIVAADKPMTVRQVFYRAVVAGLVDKTEADYKGTVARLLVEMRRDGTIPYDWIADGTRWMRQPAVYTGLGDFIERHQNAYRRDIWAELDEYVEIWVEKEALAGVFYAVTSRYGVPLMVIRGFASESYLYSAAETVTGGFRASKRRACIYFFGDFDPSGLKIGQSIEAGLRRMCRDMMPSVRDYIFSISAPAIGVGLVTAKLCKMAIWL
jgi:hypothetical protein